MMTRVLTVDPTKPDPAAIEEAATALKAGKLVVFPTETVYGLGAHAMQADAVQKIFDAKGRPSTDPLIVHIAHIGQVGQCALGMPPAARKLALTFWAGPLTLILRKKPEVPALVTAGLDSVALRVPSHRVARALMEMAGVPVAAPSANRFSRPSPTTAQHVLEDLDGKVDLILDGGPTDIGLESTIVDFTVDPPVLRRPGGLPLEQIREHVPDVVVQSQASDGATAQVAPGQLIRHYAPAATMTLYDGDVDAVTSRVAADVRTAVATGERVGILAPEEDLVRLAPLLAPVAVAGRVEVQPIGSRADMDRAGRDLFGAIRTLDATGVSRIFAIAPAHDGLGRAIRDRLMRAAEGRIRTVVQER